MIARVVNSEPRWLALAGVLLVGLAASQTWGQPIQEEPAQESSAQVAAGADADQQPPQEEEAQGLRKWEAEIDKKVGEWFVAPMNAVLFAPVYWYEMEDTRGEPKQYTVPFLVVWLMAGALFLTIYFRFINIRAFWHALRVTKGDFDDPSDAGEVSHFQALASALSATVGLGNIAGVAIAVGTGGPGAIFWMIVAGLFGMTSKFAECTLGQMYRKIDNDGHVLGGPMRYLYQGLAEKGWAPLGIVLSGLFAVLCIGGSFGGGCAFQVSQSKDLVINQFDFLRGQAWASWAYGIVMVTLVGIVIIGGIRRIASTAEKIVPAMCGIYVLAAIVILVTKYDQVPAAFASIFAEAFTPQAGYGGFLGVLVLGIRRAVFSNEAGTGSAAIAHSAAKTKYPVREGIVALLEPFIDTVLVCTMTGLVIVVTGVYDTARFPASEAMIVADQGAQLTSTAFAEELPWFPYILTAAVFLFAYSTMISWSYYGERCFTFLFGPRASMVYRVLFLCAIMMGALVQAENAKDFSDLMILSMAFPNLLGVLLLSGKVRQALNEYWGKYKRGELVEYNKLGK